MSRPSIAALPDGFLDRIADAIGREAVVTDQSDMAPHLEEMRGMMHGHAGAVLRPRDTLDVAAIVRIAREFRVRMVVHGGNTGLVGGGVPHGGVVISLARLNRIRAVDTVNATITAEAGVVLKTVQDAASAAGRLYPVSLGSEGSCTIGGNISTNAGGITVLRYGNTRDLVLGLEVVTPQGEIWNGLSGLRKDNSGYDLKHLYIGSEGTLGIITAAVLKLFPAPRTRLTAFAAGETPAAIIALFDRLRMVAGESLTSFEILPRYGIDIMLRHGRNIRDPLGDKHLFYALFELTSANPDADLEASVMRVFEAALEAGDIADATIAASEAQAAAFWQIREGLAWHQKDEGASIKHDVSVPISRVADFMVEAQAACEAALPGIRVCGFGHIGDGNLHYNLIQPVGMEPRAFLGEWQRFNDIVHGLVLARGGSIAAEHGVGMMKRDEVARFKDPVALELMRSLKRALDPDDLLNPGKVIAIGNDLPRFEPAAET